MKKRIYSMNSKGAFTLAEVLITIGVLGVVAAITLPPLVSDINDRVNSERQVNIAQKITQAMEQMRAQGKLVNYPNTEAFVDELQKYLKVNKRCDADHIAECWPTKTVAVMQDGNTENYEVSNAKTRKAILAGNSKSAYGNNGNVGLVLADGAAIILTYDPASGGKDVGDIVKGYSKTLPISKNKEKTFNAYTTSVTDSIDFIMDVNGKRGPNAEYLGGRARDIRSFKNARFAKTLDCFENGGSKLCTAYATGIDCSAENQGKGISDYDYYCDANYTGSSDYWAGANKSCDDAGMSLVSSGDLGNLSAYTNSYGDTLEEWLSVNGEIIMTSALWGSDNSKYVGYNVSSGGTDPISRSTENIVLCKP